MRTFISIELPDEVRKKVAVLISELKGSGAEVKWVSPENLHITLCFLGDVAEKEIDNLAQLTSSSAGTGSFKVNFEGVGTFPAKNPRIIWVGIKEGGGKLKKMAEALSKSLQNSAFRTEEKEFRPHMTIGRVKETKGVDKLLEKIASANNAKFGSAQVDRIHIMQSTLGLNGPVYEKLKEVNL